MNYIAYAHEGEAHESAVEATTHYLDFLTNPYIAIAIFVAILVLTGLILKKSGVGESKIALIILGLTFVGGIVGLLFVPPLGMFGVILGFVLALLLSFSGIKSGG